MCKYCPDIWEERSEEPSIQISMELLLHSSYPSSVCRYLTETARAMLLCLSQLSKIHFSFFAFLMH